MLQNMMIQPKEILELAEMKSTHGLVWWEMIALHYRIVLSVVQRNHASRKSYSGQSRSVADHVISRSTHLVA